MDKIGNITLYNADCMEVMKSFSDKEFDLAIVDPPYGIGVDGQKECICKNPKHNRKGHEHKGWDKLPPPDEYFRELERVSKNQIIWGANYFVEHLSKGTKGWIVWFKGQQGLTMSDCELAYSSFNSPTRVVTINRCELAKQNTIHPTEKPVKLYAWILNNFAQPGMRILDTHGGSMSSMIACHRGGYEATCIEMDKTYYDKAKKRLQEEVMQGSLFIPNVENQITEVSLF